MNFHATLFASQAAAKSQAEDRTWRERAATHFYYGISPNALTDFSPHETLDVPDGALLDVAKTQWTLRQMLHRAFQFTDGTTYEKYTRAMRKQRLWKADERLPRVWRFSPNVQEMESEVYSCVLRNNLSEPSCNWLLRQLHARIQNAATIAEHGMWDSKDHGAWLFGQMTGAAQKGPLRVLSTPESLHFRCENKEDCGRLIYPTNGTLQDAWRKQAESARGVYVSKVMPRTCSSTKTPISVENAAVTQGNESFDTLRHEQEHAINAFVGHPSTWIGAVDRSETGLAHCAFVSVGDTVKEELIAWSLRWRTDYAKLFLGEEAPYKPVKEAGRILTNAGVKSEELEQFTDEGYRLLTTFLRKPVTAMQALMAQYSHGVIREMLRLVPIQRWSSVEQHLRKRSRK